MATDKNTKPRTEAEIQAIFAKANSKGKPSSVELPAKIEVVPVVAAKAAEIVQLPSWADAMRCFPNEIVRSALFTARNRNVARIDFKKAVEIAVIGDGRITYKGEELRQDDATVWLQLIHLAKKYPAGQLVEFTPYNFCKLIGWSICNRSYERLRECLDRMQATALAVYSKRLKEGVSLSMIPVFAWQDENEQTLKRYRVQVAPQLVELFADVHNNTRLEWSQRLALPDGIATWLHGYYASHREPFPIKLDTIKKGAGMKAERPAKVRELIEKALSQLVRVGFLKSWEIVGDLVNVTRAPNP